MHPDDNLIVGHIALEVELEGMMKVRERLQQLGWKSRKNVSVPNPDKAGTPVDQVKTACCSGEGIFLIDMTENMCRLLSVTPMATILSSAAVAI